MEKTLKNLNADYLKLGKLVNEMETDVVSFLKERNIRGLITQATKDTDTIIAYEYDGDGNLQELEVKAIMLDPDSKGIIYLTDGHDVDYTIENVLNSFETRNVESYDYWDIVNGGEGLGWYTLINIVECLLEFDDEENYIK